MIKPPAKTPEAVVELHIQDWREWIVKGYILTMEKYHAEQDVPWNPEYDRPTPENVRVLPYRPTWESPGTVTITISGKPASSMVVERALTYALIGMKAELDRYKELYP